VETSAYGVSDIPELHVLTGASQIGDLIFSVKSFLHHYNGSIALVIHTDPSIGSGGGRTIQRHFPSARVFMKEERDAIVLPKLAERGLTQCQVFRETNVFGERLIDTAVLSKGRIIINMDTDCLTFASLDRLHSLVQEGVAAHIQDPNPQPFSISDQEAKSRFKVEPVRHFNAGLCAFPSPQLDLQKIEEWISEPEYPMESHYAEQTILASLAAQGKSEALPQKEYAFCGQKNGGQESTETARFVHYAGHYLSEARVAMRRDGQRKVLSRLEEASK
jgi:hypothetical protein